MTKYYVLMENGIPIGVAPERRAAMVLEWEKAEPSRQAFLVDECT